MTRPVRGFLTKDGKFFDSKAGANAYEAAMEFHEALSQHLETAGFTREVKDFIMDKVREFVLIHKTVVGRYTSLINSIPEVNENDLRSIIVLPTTEPVAELPMIEVDDAFVSAFVQAMGTDDPGGTTSGDVSLVGLDGESEPSLPE